MLAEIKEAHRLLAPLLGNDLAPILFAVALIAAGQSSTITGTLAGQIVMEGYLQLRINPWARRLLTRLLAIIPALIVILIYGEDKCGCTVGVEPGGTEPAIGFCHYSVNTFCK